VINPQGAGKERTQLIRSVILALRELMGQKEINSRTRDLAAFIALALLAVNDTVETSVGAWEKRDYWLKADRFRQEWAWAGRLGENLRQAVLADDWALVAQIAAAIAEKVKDIDIPKRQRQDNFWVGAWEKLQAQAEHRSR
jgi:hypothetical protein